VGESVADQNGMIDRVREKELAAIGNDMSRAARIINSICVALILAICVAWVVVMSSLPRIEGKVALDGVETGATIARDGLGVPRIVGKTRHDAYFALGWTHAQDRMWQMETQRRVGAGRLSEIAGEAGLASDRFMRTLGIYRQAEKVVPLLDQPTRSALDAYAEGVNAYLKANGHRLPLEYALTGIRPEPWRPADSVVWQKLMALQLAGNWKDDILRAQLGRLLAPKRIQELFPAYPDDAPVTLSGDGAHALLDVIPDTARPTQASNMWIVGGRHTDTGKPMLANDPHLGLRAPILWYLAELEMPGIRLAGATVPGVPFHLIGHNDRIAWGFTSTQADTVDLFMEKLAGESAYRTPEGNKPFLIHDETIRVKGGPDVVMAVRETRHGPVISDLVGKELAEPGEVVAMASTALTEGDLGLQALHRLNLARTWSAFTTALKDLQAPVLNIGYGDVDGNIGFFTAGRIPIRKSGNGSVPMKGWTGEGDWTGRVPFAKLPQAYNPRDGVLINANNKVAGNAYPYLITANWPEGYRAQRIHDLIEAQRPMTFAGMSAIQGDVVSIPALELKELLTSGIEFKSKPAQDAARMIAEWDGRVGRDRPEPLIFAAWVEHLGRAMLADELMESYEALGMPRPQVLVDILTHRRYWCDNVNTPEAESCEDLAALSLDSALAELSIAWGTDMTKWRWGEAHMARLGNPVLGHVPLLGPLANLKIPTDGDDFTINRGTYRMEAGAGRFDHVHGAGLRAVFDLADLDHSRFVIATGQASHPLSRHYADMLADWQANRLAWPQISKAGGTAVLTLTPGGS